MNVYKTKLEESAIIIAFISIVLLIIGNYTLFILLLLLNLSSIFNFFNRGLIKLSIDINSREFYYVVYKNFKVIKGSISLESDSISYKYHIRSTGINNFKELIIYNNNNILFKNNLLNVKNLNKEEMDSLVNILSNFGIKDIKE